MGKRVLVGDLAEEWYLTADGRVGTATSTTFASRSIDGTLELSVRSADNTWTTSVWASGVCLDDHSGGMRVVLDEAGRMTCTPTSRADSVVAAQPNGSVTVLTEAAAVKLAETGEVRLHDSEVGELIVHSHSAGRVLRSTIAWNQRFRVAVSCSAEHGLAWTTTRLGSRIGHEVRALGEVVVRNSPSGAKVVVTVDQVRIVESDERR